MSARRSWTCCCSASALLTFPTLLGALLPPAIFIAITVVEGQFLTPAIVGRRVLNLHPLAMFLSIAFWAWLWGPVGAFLATPILIVARVALSIFIRATRRNCRAKFYYTCSSSTAVRTSCSIIVQMRST